MDETTELLPAEETHQRTKSRLNIVSFLRENPDFPDMLRDFAPFVSETRQKSFLRAASLADAINSVDPARIRFYQMSENSPSDAFSVIKKYLPEDKKENIDNIMSFAENMRTRVITPKATNKIERMINSLTRLNEFSKLAGGARMIKELSKVSKTATDNPPDIASLMQLIGIIAGKDKVNRLQDMLSEAGIMNSK